MHEHNCVSFPDSLCTTHPFHLPFYGISNQLDNHGLAQKVMQYDSSNIHGNLLKSPINENFHKINGLIKKPLIYHSASDFQ